MKIGKQDVSEGEIRLTPENTEDLWHIERLLSPGDRVLAKTWRRFKVSEGDAGEKKPVTIKLAVEKAEFSRFANRLRVSGKIISGEPEEFVQLGAYHTIDIEPGYPLSIFKDRWLSHHLDRIKQAIAETKRPKIGMLVLDESRAIYATLRGYGVEYELELEASASKRDEKFEEKTRAFFGEILKKLQGSQVSRIIVAGPGFGKENLMKFIKEKDPGLAKKIILEHCSYAERSGINELLKKGVVSKVAAEERAENELMLMEKFTSELRKDSGLAAYGLKEVGKALELSAVDTLMVQDELLRNSKEVELLVEEAEKRKARLVIFSHESDGGRELAGFGGLAALLRFRIGQ
ncbi:MAG: mRNA surveillance protein pelota [Candidatus Micrarchaeota archaeon]|nr:mRNA surveillance protein pelota [Candidatus Micrarchaeota archaeon]